MTGVDTQKRVVRLEQHDVPYDFLILATGVQYNYFGHDEWSRIAPGLVSLSDADRIRAKVLLAFEQAEELAALELAQPTSPQIQKLLTFVTRWRRYGGSGDGQYAGRNVAHGSGT